MYPCASDDIKYYLNEWKQPNKQELKKKRKKEKNKKRGNLVNVLYSNEFLKNFQEY